jgi:hypothetical protein
MFSRELILKISSTLEMLKIAIYKMCCYKYSYLNSCTFFDKRNPGCKSFFTFLQYFLGYL